ncbi:MULTISPECIES: hypothetical protein [unclassified Streptomyces]|uniref:hypothetical protein n=1 Tax=unclassified Streptomyces TaxID=2593676 RepID=UPI003446256C
MSEVRDPVRMARAKGLSDEASFLRACVEEIFRNPQENGFDPETRAGVLRAEVERLEEQLRLISAVQPEELGEGGRVA